MACGGLVARDEEPEPPWEEGPADEAGFTRCSTPEGFAVCGEGTDCPAGKNRPGCSSCIHGTRNARGGVGVCETTFIELMQELLDASTNPMRRWACEDGLVRYDLALRGALVCVPYSLAVLLSRYVTDHDSLRYADYGLFTSAPLPEPSVCPDVEGIELCGGPCGTCDAEEICVGRSPLHPHGFCLPPEAWRREHSCGWPNPTGILKCPADLACFRFTVEPEAQVIADRRSDTRGSVRCSGG